MWGWILRSSYDEQAAFTCTFHAGTARTCPSSGIAIENKLFVSKSVISTETFEYYQLCREISFWIVVPARKEICYFKILRYSAFYLTFRSHIIKSLPSKYVGESSTCNICLDRNYSLILRSKPNNVYIVLHREFQCGE